MKMLMTGVAFILLVTGGYFYTMHDSQDEDVRADSYRHVIPSEEPQEFRTYWSTYLHEHDPARTLSAIEERYVDDHPYERHLAAHIAGEILYDDRGIEGISSCTSIYGFGCYHGFISTTIAEHGEAAIYKLDSMCIEEFGGGLDTENCQHGVGHGVLEFLGHTDIPKALALCDRANDVFPELGCKSGVFMEYFNPMSDIKADVGKLTPLYDPADPYNVCDELPSEEALTCVFEAHGWWRDTAGLNPQEISELCEGVSSDRVKKYCYLGHGNFIAPQYDFSIPDSTEYCGQMVTKEGEVLCRAGVLWRLHFERGLDEAQQACEGLPSTQYNRCIEAGSITCELENTCSDFEALYKTP